jgi:type I thyroxine 5'-deiodinase
VKAGETCWTKLKIPFPMLVDDLDDHVGRRYQAWPIRVYIVDKDGKIAWKTLPGPFGFEAELVRPAFDKHLGAPVST